MLSAKIKKHTFVFKHPGGTSRGVLTHKDSWYIIISAKDYPGIYGIGECSIIPNLSIDNLSNFEAKLIEVCKDIDNWKFWLEQGLYEYPAIRFGLETAINDMAKDGMRVLFPSLFTEGKDSIPINGLVWMGDYSTMRKRIIEKIELGFGCIKLKIGAINFEDELSLLKLIRSDFSDKDIEIRLDANGAFSSEDALAKLSDLSQYKIHSIEQPIMPNQWSDMNNICRKSPIAIALDEELIGLHLKSDIGEMLDSIIPHYIILKPGLLGGLAQSSTFIREAENRNINWWITSALEGNIGLNAISQWTYTLNNPLPQGLGTGELFENNIESPLKVEMANLYYLPNKSWNINSIVDE